MTCAAQGPDPATEPPLRFRRVYAPADRLKDWPRDNLRYVPVDAAEFERLAALAQAQAGEAALPPCPLAEARYRARLEGDTLVDGEAVLRFAPAPSHRARWVLEPWNPAVSEALWTTNPPEPATLLAAGDGKLAVLAHPSRSLRLLWSLRGTRDPEGMLEFAFHLPPCPLARLELDLPKDLQPVIESGLATPQPSAQPDRVEWALEPGPHPQFSVRMVPVDQLGAGQSLDTLRQATLYEISPRGVEVTSQWTMDIRSPMRHQIALELDPGLRLSGAWLGETPLRWSAAAPAPADKPSRAWIELPEPIRGPNRVLRLAAIGPVALGRPWRLPEIRPRHFFWQEGTIRLLITAPLALEHLSAEGARQTGTGSLPAPRAGESADLQCFGPSPGVNVILALAQPQLQWRCGTLVELGSVELRAHVVAQFHAVKGEQFQISADVRRGWTIQAVESVPADALDDWSQEGTTGGKLAVRLARGLLPGRPLELRITAHCLAGPKSGVWTSHDLVPLRFAGQPGQFLLGLRAQEGYQLHLAGDQRWTRLDAAHPTDAEQGLMPRPWPPFVFRYDPRLAGFQVRVEKFKPSFTASIRVEVLVVDGRLAEVYQIRGTSDSSRVDRVLVRFAPGRAAPLHWTLVGGPADGLSARQRPHPPGPAEASAETWEVSFRRPQEGPFELRAVRSVPFAGPTPVCLVALPEAKSQRGTVVVGASGGEAFRVENHRLLPLPPEAVPLDRAPLWRASFQYDPATDCGAASEDALVLRPAESSELLPAAWVWNFHLGSRFMAPGKGHHVAEFRIENTGRGQLGLLLPPGLTAEHVRNVWVDGVRTGWSIGDNNATGQTQLVLPLPPTRRFPVVAVHFVTPARTMGPWARLAPPLWEPDIPVLRRTWSVWLPPGYAACGPPPTSWPLDPSGPVERLAGPFAQSTSHLASGSWWQPLVGAAPAPPAAQIEEFLARLAKTEETLRKRTSATEAESKTVAPVTWGQLLAETLQGAGFSLLIDEPGLSTDGLTPQTPVSPPAGMSLPARGRAILAQAELMVLAASDAWLLTSRTRAALLRPHLSNRDAVWAVATGPLAEQIQETWHFGSGGGMLAAQTWSRLPPSAMSPWASPALAGEGPTDAMGWSVAQWEVPNDGFGVWVVDEDTMEVARWAALVILLAIMSWGSPSRLGRRVLVIGALACAALVVPQAFVPPCSGALVGATAGAVLSLFRRQAAGVSGAEAAAARRQTEPSPQRPADSPSPKNSTGRRPAQASLGAWLLACCAATFSWAQDPSAPVFRTPQPVYQVIIPTEAGQAAASKYLVPETFYAELQRRAEGPPEPVSPWTLSGAVYRGIAAWKAAPEQLVVLDLRALYDLEVHGRNVRLVLPLGSELVQPVPGGVLLDGRPASVRSVGEAGLELEIAESGRYRLEVPLHVTVQSAGGWSGFDTRIPPLATARLEWTVPRDTAAIEVPSALGRVRFAPEGGRLLAELGPTPRLAMRWPEGPPRSLGGPLLDVEQLLWFKLQPGSAVLDVTLRCRMLQGRVRRIELLADPRLRLTPGEGDRSWLAGTETVPGPVQTLRLDLASTVPDQFDASLSFLVTDTSAVGQLRLPLVTVAGARTLRRWLAVSIDPSLQYQQSGAEGLRPVAVPTFLAAWGPARAEPLFVYELPAGEPSWSISTRPAPPRTTAEQTLSIALGPGRGELFLDAQLVTQPGPRFQHRLLVPRGVEIERVALLDQSAEQPLRFARPGAGDEVTVFLPGPASGKAVLRVLGHFAVPESGTLDVPLVRVLADETKSFNLQLFRQPHVRIEPVRIAGLVPVETPAPETSRFATSRCVACWKSSAAEAIGLRLKIAPNRPHLRGEQITVLYSEGPRWSAETEFRLDVQGGLADEFRLDVPAEWPGPYKVEPPMAVKPAEAGAQGRRIVVVRPAAAVEGKFRFRVSGPLVADSGTPPAAPRVVLHEAELTRHRLVLPVRSQLQSLFWEMGGLAPASLPDDFAPPAKSPDSYAAFQVVHEPFRTILRCLGQMSGVSQVLLADVALAAQADGACRGVAAFDVQPAGLADCPLELPQPLQLLQVTVEGTPVLPVPQGPGRFRIPLGLNLLPQRIEVVFEAHLAQVAAQGAAEFPLPRLGDLPVQKTLWTIAKSAPSAEGVAPADPTEPLYQELQRLKHLTAVAELGADLPEDDPPLARRWFLPWARRWRASLDHTRRLLALAEENENTEPVRAEVESLQARQTRAAQRLHAAEVLAQVLSETPLATGAAALWSQTFGEETSVARGMSEGPLAALPLAATPSLATPPLPLPLATLMAAALTLGLSLAASRPAVAHTLHRWPTLVLAATGAVWWLWLRPPVLGMLATLAGVAGTAWLAWKRRPTPRPR